MSRGFHLAAELGRVDPRCGGEAIQTLDDMRNAMGVPEEAALHLLQNSDSGRLSAVEYKAQEGVRQFLDRSQIPGDARVSLCEKPLHYANCHREMPDVICEIKAGPANFWQLFEHIMTHKKDPITMPPPSDSTGVLYIEAPDFDAMEAWLQHAFPIARAAATPLSCARRKKHHYSAGERIKIPHG